MLQILFIKYFENFNLTFYFTINLHLFESNKLRMNSFTIFLFLFKNVK